MDQSTDLRALVLGYLLRARGAWNTAHEIHSAVSLEASVDASVIDVIAVCRVAVESGELERSAPLLGSVAHYRTRICAKSLSEAREAWDARYKALSDARQALRLLMGFSMFKSYADEDEERAAMVDVQAKIDALGPRP